MSPWIRFAWVTMGWVLLQSGVVTAQAERSCAEETTAEACEALELFNQAGAARAERRLGDARDLLKRSLDLDPAAPTAFNLAGVLADTGDYVAAIELYDALQAGDFGEIPPDRLTRVRERSLEAAQRVATILVRVRIDVPVRASLDGEVVHDATEARTFDLRVNPGEHHVRVAAVDGSRELQRTLGLGPGGTASLVLEAPAAPPVPQAIPVRASDAERGFFESPWFWVVAGVLVAGGIATALALTLTADADGVVDPVLGNVGTLRF